ncbi:hypothetical protein [Hoeflea sp. TYP-13]|uniref:hypothetical protein n=1 Tax=Hoeflea sp. TYP-13 TaxID=3230023 RepID=UPI0034C5C800
MATVRSDNSRSLEMDQIMDVPSQSIMPPEITLDKTVKPRGRRGRLDMNGKETVLRLYAGGVATTDIADRFGVDETYIRKLACRYGIRKGQLAGRAAPPVDHRKKPIRNDHLAAFKRARRGFEMPQELEPKYVRLLISGLSCRQAAAKLGLMEDVHDGA